MEYIVLIIFFVVVLIILKAICKVDSKKIKEIGDNNKHLDEIVNKYPENIDICKDILKKLKNETVRIEEDKEASNCLYIAITNKIIIANMRNSFTRIQTIAHECLHSIQDRTMLLFNFIYSNIYMIYFASIAILGILKILPQKMLFLSIYIFLAFIYYFIRAYLENDAMIKARFLAKEYMEEKQISSKQEINLIVDEYDKLNTIGIKAINYSLFFTQIIKVIILCVIFLVR